MTKKFSIIEREEYSQNKLNELSNKLKIIPELCEIQKLTIFSAGSFARLEASEHSDLDIFFLSSVPRKKINNPNTNRIKLFGNIIDLVVDDMKFPKFSNDGEYLKILHTDEIISHLGSPVDDYENNFTARMLLLLESKCLFGKKVYNGAIKRVVRSYFRDYPKHKNDFRPIFLMNDIMRFWKTLCLNYEHRRKINSKEKYKIEDNKQKVKNFKLKFSRMTTCFATISSLSWQINSIMEEDVINLIKLTPRERLMKLSEDVPMIEKDIDKLIIKYNWFLHMTSFTTEEINDYFGDKDKRRIAFEKADSYGNDLYKILKKLDNRYNFIRYLVI